MSIAVRRGCGWVLLELCQCCVSDDGRSIGSCLD